ncbi:diphthine--ammonia ligase [Aquimarina sp. SS2-1]|uniref:Dph6-related ATP pyrophosphatase n=1 Tax=Aquimarina besae TaxID=3342247 RepID=UPI00366B7369
MNKAYFNWSSGKDSAIALYLISKRKEFKVTKLFTTVNADYNRVTMHGLREELLDKQIHSLDLPFQKVYLPKDVSMELYEEKMLEAVSQLKAEGFTHSIFGDIFLQDLRSYREEQLRKIGIKAVFPLWKKDTKELLVDFINEGFKAITVCVNAKYLDKSFCGRLIDHSFLKDLPNNVDPCGENGEFHTFVFDGPIFAKPINFTIGEKVLRSYTLSKNNTDNCFTDTEEKNWDSSFWYCDLVPK